MVTEEPQTKVDSPSGTVEQHWWSRKQSVSTQQIVFGLAVLLVLMAWVGTVEYGWICGAVSLHSDRVATQQDPKVLTRLSKIEKDDARFRKCVNTALTLGSKESAKPC